HVTDVLTCAFPICLADVLVAVTGYKGYLPARGDAVLVEGRDCAWNTRTVAVTYGQRIDIVSRDDNTYAPELMGQPWPVQLLATPKGDRKSTRLNSSHVKSRMPSSA